MYVVSSRKSFLKKVSALWLYIKYYDFVVSVLYSSSTRLVANDLSTTFVNTKSAL